MPVLCSAGMNTRWEWPSQDCTSSLGEMTVTGEVSRGMDCQAKRKTTILTMNITERSGKSRVKNWQFGKVTDKEKQHLKVTINSHNENKVFVEKCVVFNSHWWQQQSRIRQNTELNAMYYDHDIAIKSRCRILSARLLISSSKIQSYDWRLLLYARLTSPSVQSSMMIQTGFSVITPISFTIWGWSNWRMVTARKESQRSKVKKCSAISTIWTNVIR